MSPRVLHNDLLNNVILNNFESEQLISFDQAQTTNEEAANNFKSEDTGCESEKKRLSLSTACSDNDSDKSYLDQTGGRKNNSCFGLNDPIKLDLFSKYQLKVSNEFWK